MSNIVESLYRQANINESKVNESTDKRSKKKLNEKKRLNEGYSISLENNEFLYLYDLLKSNNSSMSDKISGKILKILPSLADNTDIDVYDWDSCLNSFLSIVEVKLLEDDVASIVPKNLLNKWYSDSSYFRTMSNITFEDGESIVDDVSFEELVEDRFKNVYGEYGRHMNESDAVVALFNLPDKDKNIRYMNDSLKTTFSNEIKEYINYLKD